MMHPGVLKQILIIKFDIIKKKSYCASHYTHLQLKVAGLRTFCSIVG